MVMIATMRFSFSFVLAPYFMMMGFSFSLALPPMSTVVAFVLAPPCLFSLSFLSPMVAVVALVFAPVLLAFLPLFPVLFAPTGLILIGRRGRNGQRCEQQKRECPSETLPHEFLQLTAQ